MHKHLSRLEHVWLEWPVYFVTTCTFQRRQILTSPDVAKILVNEWTDSRIRHGWAIGRYVIMRDHVHFFCFAEQDAVSLERFVQRWKEWTSKRITRELGIQQPIWQKEFFDHVLRSEESHAEKWEYVRDNPVRAALATKWSDWPFIGEIFDLEFRRGAT